MRYLPAMRTDTDNPGDTVADTDDARDADKAADCTVAPAVDETVGVAGVGIAAPDASDVDADADVDAGAVAADDDDDDDDDAAAAGDTIHDYNHPYHNEVTFHGHGRILSSR